MSRKGVVSYGSEVYHRSGCYYVGRMLNKNKLRVTVSDAINHGCRACSYCNSMNFRMSQERHNVEYVCKVSNMKYRYIKEIIYVKTSIGNWKIVYNKRNEYLELFHGNRTGNSFDFEHPENELYHRQRDIPSAETICSLLDYISDHDRYKASVKNGEKITQFTSRESKARYEKSEKKRKAKNLERLFRIIEMTDHSMKKYSYC